MLWKKPFAVLSTNIVKMSDLRKSGEAEFPSQNQYPILKKTVLLPPSGDQE